jgi:hypothetical protein
MPANIRIVDSVAKGVDIVFTKAAAFDAVFTRARRLED